MADVKWIKIVTDLFDDEKILLIESLPESDSIIVIWFKLLCLAGKQNNSGVFLMNDRIAYTDEMLATIFRRKVTTVRMALKTFEDFGMIEIINDVITIPNWNKHQSLDAYEKKKLRDRLYQAERRANQKAIAQKSSDTSSDCQTTPSSDIAVSDIDKEEDKEKDKDKNKKETFVSVVASYTDNDELKSALKDYVEMRQKTKGFTVKALKLNLNELDKLATDDFTKIDIVNQTVMNGWKGFYQLKNNKTQQQQKSQNQWQNSMNELAAMLEEGGN